MREFEGEEFEDVLEPDASALLLIDVQNDFLPGGALAVPGAEKVVPVLNRAIERFTSRGRPVYASRDWHPPDTTHFKAYGGPWPPHCIAGTPGAQFHPGLRIPSDTIIVSTGQGREDDGYSAVEGVTQEGRGLVEDLRERGVSEVYVGGVATDYCVRATVLDLRRAGFPVKLIEDGVAGIGEQDTVRALEQMQRAGAEFVSSEKLEG
jgi:nicotinamidase/pyrazinamidase